MQRACLRILGLTVSGLLLAQCAARRPALTPSELAGMHRAEVLVRAGCYRCLQEAHAIYERLVGASAPRAPELALRGAFEVTLLLAVREKELGLSPDVSLAHARALLSELVHTSASDRSRPAELLSLLEAAEEVEGNLAGLDAEERQQRDSRPQQSPEVSGRIGRLLRVLLSGRGADLGAMYLALAIDCEQPRERRALDPAAVLEQTGDPPLLRYRVAICSNGPPTALTRLREADARWSELRFFEGRHEMGGPARAAEPERAVALLKPGSDEFSGSIAIHVLLASAQEMAGDVPGALGSFDRILALKPGHLDAQIGRVRSLSQLGRAEEATTGATALIEHGSWHVGDALYWRAWNAYQTRRLDPAWLDVQRALRLQANTTVYTLAGSVAYARNDLDAAVRHFDDAFAMDRTNCFAASSSGLAHMDRAAWPVAADRFSQATDCFARAADAARADVMTLEQSALDAPVKVRRLMSARRRLDSAEESGSQSALNVAQSFVYAGDTRLARAYLERAERHPTTRGQALVLKARIAAMR